MRRVGAWSYLHRVITTAGPRFDRSVRRALAQEANFLRGHMVKGLTSGAPGGQKFAPLSPITLAVRKFQGFGGSKALMVSGGLRGAISVVKIGGGAGIGGAVFVGVHRSARAKGGRGMMDIADIHEFGRTWRMAFTPKMRGFLFAALGKSKLLKGPATRDTKGRFQRGRVVRAPAAGGGGGMITIHIQARPFVRPIVDAFAKPADVKKRFLLNVANGMGGDFGAP